MSLNQFCHDLAADLDHDLGLKVQYGYSPVLASSPVVSILLVNKRLYTCEGPKVMGRSGRVGQE